jgi:hypothetical protein
MSPRGRLSVVHHHAVGRLRGGRSSRLLASITVWLSMVERYVRDVEVGGSNPLTVTQS